MKLVRHRARAGLAVAATLPLVAGALAMGVPTAQADSNNRQVLTNTKPLWATARADHGTAAGSTTVNARVYLAGKDAQGLASYAQGVSDPSSPNYGKYLTPKQVQDRFGTTRQQIAEVTAWLRNSGLTVTGSNQHYVAVSGDKAAVEKAFNTELRNYSKDGHLYHAPAQAASVPASLHGAVLTITGLDNAPKQSRHDELPPPEAVARQAGPFSTYYGSNVAKNLPKAYGGSAPYVVKGYTGKQLRAAYGAKGYTGKGVTVAITDAFASPYIAKDAAEYAKRNGDAAYKSGQFTQVLPSAYNNIDSCKAAGWYGEETLDVEAVHAVAPGANIVYVGAASCNDPDLMDSLNKVVDNRLADIVSNSWSDVEANETPDVAAAYDQIFQQGAVEGIGFYFSSGDNGDELANTGTKQIDTPANSAWVTSVGGTSLAVGKGDKYQWETGWGTTKATLSADGKNWSSLPGDYLYGAGGGTSKLTPQPYYQRGVVPDTLSKQNGATPQRVVPDIAAVADPSTGFLVGQSQTFPDHSVKYSEYRIGGTSLAAPVISAIQALAQQARGGVPIGFANPAIYDRFGTSAYHDVTDHPLGQGQSLADVRVDFKNGFDAKGGYNTSLRTLGHDSSLNATIGFDNVTGVGSPGADYVLSYRPRH
ncbi:S53 family peptidase [Streptomyces sp. RPT161]|uniref:S53 family peptidase n=1 Tax=Streptomyces sp. RPT161 TaxID=3015993 RepID=UPI0022B8FFE9|nr:S53 family peptidase [Streptomyces sp. RPT161]